MKVYIETYGCQMNEYDSEIVQSILFADGFQEVSEVQDADVLLMNTCAVREHASHRVLARIGEIRRSGIATLIVDRDWRNVLGCSDHAVVLLKGQVVMAGESARIADDPGLAGYLGV